MRVLFVLVSIASLAFSDDEPDWIEDEPSKPKYMALAWKAANDHNKDAKEDTELKFILPVQVSSVGHHSGTDYDMLIYFQYVKCSKLKAHELPTTHKCKPDPADKEPHLLHAMIYEKGNDFQLEDLSEYTESH